MKRILPFLFFFLTTGALASPSFDFESDNVKHHVTADRTLYHTKEKVYEAFGHVVISSRGKRLACDYAWLDTTNNELKAKGNVIFVNQSTTIQSAEMHYNLITGTGTIFYGRVSNDVYTLRGQLIRRVSTDHFLTSEGEFTTCKDCAESWKFAAKDVDVTFDGYAFMSNVYVNVKDVPALYIPYLVVPVKSRRQSGFLFPRIGGGSSHGFTYIQPFFIAIDPHQDATVALGKYSAQGKRYEAEYRYKFGEHVDGNINYFHTKDTHYQFTENRYAIRAENEWGLASFGNIHWRLNEVSDKDYIFDFPEDINGLYFPNLESNVVWNLPRDDFFISVEASRYRNLLTDSALGFDGGTVQAMPSVYFGEKERKLFGPIMAGFTSRVDNFVRPNGGIQDVAGNGVYNPSTDWIREAKRINFSPEISAPFKLGKSVSVVPSVQYNENYYVFHLPGNNDVANTSTRYLLAKVETSTVFERVYSYQGDKVNRIQHQIQPFITYSNIPWLSQDRLHPFTQQLLRQGGQFDQYDIIPVSNSSDYLRVPEGNSVFYGFTSRLIRHMRSPAEVTHSYPYDQLTKSPRLYPEPQNKMEEINIERSKARDAFLPRYADYQDVWDFSAEQAYDFNEAKNYQDKKYAFSFLLARSDLSIDDFSNSIEYKFYPRLQIPASASDPIPQSYSSKYAASMSTTWYLKHLTNIHGTRSFIRSISLNYADTSVPPISRSVGGEIFWSLNDYFAVDYSRNMDLIAHTRLNQTVKTIFSSPSECWALGLHFTQDITTGSFFGIDLGLNLFGTGYVGVNKAAPGSTNSFGGI